MADWLGVSRSTRTQCCNVLSLQNCPGAHGIIEHVTEEANIIIQKRRVFDIRRECEWAHVHVASGVLVVRL